VFNDDTAAKTVVISLNVATVLYKVVSATIQVDETLGYTDTNGWYVQNANGERKTSGIVYGSALPLMNGTAATGTATPPSREDHVHPTDTSRMAVATYDSDGDGFVDDAEAVSIAVRNITGVAMTKVQAVYVSGATGQTATVALAKADAEATSANTIGLLLADIANNANGNAVLIGRIEGVDTSAFADGALLYLSPTVAGGMTSTKPAAPNQLVFIGYVTYSHATQGKIAVKIDNGFELEELHNVSITAVADKNALQYDSATSLWKNVSEREAVANKGSANGYASLDASGLVPVTQIPPAALERMVVVATQAARYALTTATVQNGDSVKQTDTGEMWYVVDQTNLANSAGYSIYTAGTASAVALGGVTGLGTGVATALAINVGSAGSIVTNGGALGTPTSGVTDNLTTTTSAAAIVDTDFVDSNLAAGGKRKVLWTAVKTYLATTFAALGGSATQAFSTSTAAAGSNTTIAASTAFVNSAVAMVANPKALSQGVALTASASVGGIAVADNANIDLGTGNFTLHWEGSLPDWTPTAHTLILKWAANLGYTLGLSTSGNVTVYINATVYTSTVVNTFENGTHHKIDAVVTRESASVDGSIVFYVDGVQLGASVTITAGVPSTVDTATSLYVLGITASHYAGTVNSALVYNRALSASAVLSLYNNGVDENDKDGSQTAQTSGVLAIGKRYIIDTFVAGDSFTNVGAASNASGVEFTATGTTPTTWTNSSSLRRQGTTLRLEQEGISLGIWHDSSSNNLNASYPDSGFSFTRPMLQNMHTLPVTAKTTSATLTIAEMLTRKITGTHTAGATQTYTLPTATLMDAALPSMHIDESFEWSLINLSAAAADTITLAVGTNHTIVGNTIVQSAHATTGALYGNSARFETQKTATNTYVTYRIA